VVDAAVADHLEILRLVTFRGFRVVERVDHADAVQRLLHDAVDERGCGQLGDLEDRWCNIDDVVKLRADLSFGLDPVGPVDDRAVARAAEV
jgi:hypothetical protein